MESKVKEVQYGNIRRILDSGENPYEFMEKAHGDDRWMYVGRWNRRISGFGGSPLANPFRPKVKGQGETLEDYRAWLWGKMCMGDPDVIQAIERIAKGEVDILYCWCETKEKCHSSVIIKAADWYLREVINGKGSLGC